MIPTTIAGASELAEGRWAVDPYSGWLTAIRDLRADWTGGARPGAGELRNYLQSVPPAQQAEACRDLVAEHMRLSWETGCGQLLEVYLPELDVDTGPLESPDEILADLIEDEFLARYVVPFGDTPLPDEYQRRFGRHVGLDRLRRRELGGGRYVKLRQLGIGGMAEVFEAYDHRLRRFVAIKQPKLRTTDAEVLRRFEEEARIAARLSHPAIVAVHEYHDASNDSHALPFLVMRLASSETLKDRIRDYYRSQRSADEQQIVARGLLDSLLYASNALDYAHAQGVLHGDLKPQNIAVGQFGETVVLDWGKVAGTPEYMSPEQVDGVADARTDVFGLGGILYEILTGRPPHAWQGDGQPADWPQRVREARFASPCRLNAQAPRALEAVCLKALSREPGDRYQSVADFTQQLRCYLAGQAMSGKGALSRWWRKLYG